MATVLLVSTLHAASQPASGPSQACLLLSSQVCSLPCCHPASLGLYFDSETLRPRVLPRSVLAPIPFPFLLVRHGLPGYLGISLCTRESCAVHGRGPRPKESTGGCQWPRVGTALVKVGLLLTAVVSKGTVTSRIIAGDFFCLRDLLLVNHSSI